MANKNIQIQDVDGNNLYPVSLIKVTYAQLKSLRDKSNLMPGMLYRITDYRCTTTQEDTQSAGHQFDIIVTADSSSKLNEKARAVLHDGDTYFASCNLAAWELWYCLDNDTNKFVWADATNGKGVIYRMIDEFNNDCPYDFKNILFKRYKITGGHLPGDLIGKYLAYGIADPTGTIDKNDSIWCYTFNGARIKAQPEDSYDSLIYEAENLDLTVAMAGKEYYNENCGNSSCCCCNNIIRQKISDYSTNILFLNNIVLNGEFADKQSWMDFGNNITITAFCPTCNFFGINCSYTSFGLGCYENTFGLECYNNIFGNSCNSNSFENNCNSNSFGDGCNSNSFGNDCNSNSFGNSCNSNSFENNCNSNSFENNCNSNSFGDGCNYNSFGDGCYYNSFGNDCNYNSFGDGCYYNSFENNCNSNSFGNSCYYNSFGIDSSNNKLDAYYKYNKLDNGVQYVTFSGTGTNTNYVQNYHIKQGMTFTSSLKHTIIAKLGVGYELSVAKQTDGIVVEYCEADLYNPPKASMNP